MPWIMDTAIVADNHAVDNWALENGSDYRAAGANASVYISVRADWVLIDDHPVKGRESADFDLQRETIWTTLNDDVFTRMKPNAKISIAHHPLACGGEVEVEVEPIDPDDEEAAR